MEMSKKKIDYLGINISDESLYIALVNKVAQKKSEGNRKATIKELAERYLWQGIRNDK
jgi:hypothetical protein